MDNPKRYADKLKRKEDGNNSGVQIPTGSYNMVQSMSVIKPLFEPHFKSIHSKGSAIHTKLEISQPEDPSEVQADQMADSFMEGDAEHSQAILSQPTAEISRSGEGDAMETSDRFDQQLQGTKGQGQKLDEETKNELEAHTGKELGGVNIHTSPAANELSAEIGALAFAHGNDIYFNEGKYNPQNEEGMGLLAHEIAHVVQEATSGMIMGKIFREISDETFDLGAQLSNASKDIRQAALDKLIIQNDRSAWQLLLLAQKNEFIDVSDRVAEYLKDKAKNDSAFKLYVDELAGNPQGEVSDMAIFLLINTNLIQGNINTKAFSIENYRNIIREKINMAVVALEDFDEQEYHLLQKYPDTKATITGSGDLTVTDLTWYRQKSAALGKMTVSQLNELSMIMSDVLFSIGLVQDGLTLLNLNLQSAGEGSFKDDLVKKKKALLKKAGLISGDNTQVDQISTEVYQLQGDINVSVVKGLKGQLNDIKTQLVEFASFHVETSGFFHTKDPGAPETIWEGQLPRTAFGNIGGQVKRAGGLREKLVPPFQKEVNDMLASANLALLEKYANQGTSGAELFTKKLQELAPALEKIFLKYTMIANAIQHFSTWNQLYASFLTEDQKVKDEYLPTISGYLFRRAFAFLDAAQLADKDPEMVKNWYAAGAKDDQETQLPEKFREFVGEYFTASEEAFKAKIQVLEILILILSIYTMGAAGFFLRGLTVELAASLAASRIGTMALRLGILLGEGMAFHITNRGLRSIALGEKFYSDNFWEEYGRNTLMFGFLGQAGRFYEGFLGPRVATFASKIPYKAIGTTVQTAAQFSYSFSAFQLWSNAVYLVDNKGFPTWKEQLKMAEENVLLLGAIHIGMKLSQQIGIDIQKPALKYWAEKHNLSVETLKTDLNTYMKQDYKEQKKSVEFLKRIKQKVIERTEIYKNIRDAKGITAEEYAYIESVYGEYKAAIDRLLSMKDVEVTYDASNERLIYYEGDAKKTKDSFKAAGYVVPDGNATSFTVTLNGVPYKVIQSNTKSSKSQQQALRNSISDIVLRAGFDFVTVQKDFGILDAGMQGDDYAVEAGINLRLYDAWVTKNWRPGQPLAAEYKKDVDEYNLRKIKERNRKRLVKAYGETTVAGLEKTSPDAMNALINQSEALVENFTSTVISIADFVLITEKYGAAYSTLVSITGYGKYYDLTTQADVITFIPTAAEIGKLLSAKLKADIETAENLNTLLSAKDNTAKETSRSQFEQPGIIEFVQEMHTTYAVSLNAVFKVTDALQKSGESGVEYRGRVDQLLYNSEAVDIFYNRVFNKSVEELDIQLRLMAGEIIRIKTANGHDVTVRLLSVKGDATQVDKGDLGKQGETQLYDLTQDFDNKNNDVRYDAMRDLRKGPGKNKKDRNEQLSGTIYTPFLEAQIKAIADLRVLFQTAAKGGVNLVLTFDRGGTLILDQINAAEIVPGKIVNIEKPDNVKSTSKFQRGELKRQVEELMESDPNKKAKIFFVEEFVSGTEIKGSTEVMKNLLKEYPNLEFELFLLQQTKQIDAPENPGEFLAEHVKIDKYVKQGRFTVHSVQVPFIIGADVDYQSNKNSTQAQKPIPIFDIVNGKVQPFLITPDGKTTSRDIIIDLSQGQLKGKIGNIH